MDDIERRRVVQQKEESEPETFKEDLPFNDSFDSPNVQSLSDVKLWALPGNCLPST
jgi:hypothetical protein